MRDPRITGLTRRLLDIERTEQSVLIEAEYWASTRLPCGCSFECNDGCMPDTQFCWACGEEYPINLPCPNKSQHPQWSADKS